MQIAQLALKHRQNKNQRQRIVIFMGSPLSEDKVRCSLSFCNVDVKGYYLLPASLSELHGVSALKSPSNISNAIQDKLVKVGKKLKKNNVAVDIVSFGSEEANAEKLEAFVQAVNSGENSHLVTVPAGTILADMLFGSPIFQTEGEPSEHSSFVKRMYIHA